MYRRTHIIAAALMLLASSAAFAHDDRDPVRYGRVANAYDFGRQNGYRDGYEHGIADLRSRRGYELESRDYKRGDRGYRNAMGSKGQYKQGYRDAYRQGYDAAFQRAGRIRDRRDDRYGRGGYGAEAQRAAYDHGFADGVWYAQQDLRKGRRLNPAECKGYRDADHGYRSHYDRDEFKRVYRDAFARAYEQTFNQRAGVWRR